MMGQDNEPVGSEPIDAGGLLLANLLIAAATGLAAALSVSMALPVWAMLLGAVIFFSGGLRLRDGAAAYICLTVGTLLGAGGGLAIQLLTPELAGATVPLVVMALTFLVLCFQFIPIFNNMLAYYLGLIQFVASGWPPTVGAVGALMACGMLGACLAILSFRLQHHVVAWRRSLSLRLAIHDAPMSSL